MLEHDQIMNAKLIAFPDGEVVNIDTDSQQGEVVFVKGSVNEEFYNLLRGSAVMYQTLSFQSEQLEALIEAAKAVGADAIVPKLEEMLAPIHFALMIAINGVEAYIQQPKQ